MTMDITGITNENEFYTHHYLSAILENDLKEVFSRWKEQEDENEIPQPHSRLRNLRKEYFSKISLLERERSIEERINIQHEFISKLLSCLGYEFHYQIVELDDNGAIPLIGGISKSDGSPELWIIETILNHEEETDLLESHLLDEQYRDGRDTAEDDEIKKILDTTLEEIITRQVFGRTEPPRWVLLVNFHQLLLLDRTKWHEKRLLRFDLKEILDRRETSTLQAMAALLHKDSICPEDGTPLLDTLDENSHKHAFSVSEDLKYSLREAIELLGNEAVYYLREHLHEKIYGKDMAGQLSLECLRYMYRLLFLFYIEARPELGFLPDKSEEFRKGYSLETLRDLEMIQLTTEESKNRFFLHESIQTLFNLLYNGFKVDELDVFATSAHHIFEIEPLRCHLFNPQKTPILSRVKFRNFVLQKVIRLMSLSRPKKGSRNRRGRISYAQLGINQLGAVYEALLSYQGFFAETDLYEVKKAKESHDVLNTAYFVKPEDLEQYTEDERVYNEDGTLVIYEKGTFIYRLAGRDREKSASYYTPEVLTQCLVKYALKELLKDKTADEILNLTVCEPAMGSAAFLNEAVNQLSKAYLDRKQKELNEIISHEDYPRELQKVKMYIADNNVHGVDLNPVAVELAEVSLWLNTIYKGAFVPWFGMQLVCGNSLVGARRQVFDSHLPKKGKRTDSLWLDEIPKRVKPGEQRDPDTVYHFLLPDKSMADYTDKVVKKLAEDQIKEINDWRKEFIKPLSKSEINQLKKLSDATDKLWASHVAMQRDINSRTTDPLKIFGQNEPDKKLVKTTTEFKDNVLDKEMFSKNVRNSSPYRRLKLVMDYWCALWFWPIEKSGLLPSRAEYLFDVTLILEGNLFDVGLQEGEQLEMFASSKPRQTSLEMIDELGFVDVDKLCKGNERLGIVGELGERYRFLHWELEFANLFETRGGFDLILGNPPWIKIRWEEAGILGESEAMFAIRNFSSSKLATLRNDILKSNETERSYLTEYEEADGMQNYFKGNQNYPELQGVQTNLFKCFMPLAWYLVDINGVSAFIHDFGIFQDPKAGILRQKCYERLTYWFRFENEKNLFAQVGHAKKYEISVFGRKSQTIAFDSICNLYHPVTIDNCYNHTGVGPIPKMKTEKSEWDLSGHKERIIRVDKELLQLFAQLYDDIDKPFEHARLPALYAKPSVSVLKKIVGCSTLNQKKKGEFFSTEMWHETNTQKDGTIKRKTDFPNRIEDFVLSGPHINILNPLYQTPKEKCNSSQAYDIIDLSLISENYLPRTNYYPACSEEECKKKTPKVTWGSKNFITDYYRLVHRRRLNSSQERTFISSILPPFAAHINTIVSTTFKDYFSLLDVSLVTASVVFDFWVKTTGRNDFTSGSVGVIPYISNSNILNAGRIRILKLVCSSKFYAQLWADCWDAMFRKERWAKKDFRLTNKTYSEMNKKWCFESAYRTDYERRQALIEIDVLTAMGIGITLKDLKGIYRTQFTILNQYEADTWFDQNGRIVFTNSRGLTGVGFARTEWNNIKEIKSGSVDRNFIDDTQPEGPVERTITYHAPFDRCDREKDYEEVWAEFERRFKEAEEKGRRQVRV